MAPFLLMFVFHYKIMLPILENCEGDNQMIQLVNISIAFHNSVSILRNVNMDIHRGDLIHITGSNGSENLLF